MLVEEVIEVVVEVGVTDEVKDVVDVLVLASQSLQLIPSTTMPAEDKYASKAGKILVEYQGTPVNII